MVLNEKLGRGSAREGSDAGEKVRSRRLEEVDADLQRGKPGKLGSRDPNRMLQLEKPPSDPWRLFFCRGLGPKSPSLRKPRS